MVHRPYKGIMAYEWRVGRTVFQFCHNDMWNWREYATLWRINVLRLPR